MVLMPQIPSCCDYDGRPVYLSDIIELQADKSLRVVVWNAPSFGFGLQYTQDFCDCKALGVNNFTEAFFKVAGNIWENPELVKG